MDIKVETARSMDALGNDNSSKKSSNSLQSDKNVASLKSQPNISNADGSKRASFRVRDSMRSIRESNTSIDRPIISLYPRKSVSIVSRDSMMANRTSILQLAEYAIDRTNSSSKPSINTSKPSINNLNKSGESFARPVSLISLKKLNQIRESAPNLAVDEIPQPAINSEYLDYLMLQQRHSSCNFIQKIDSNEIVWETKQTQIKMLGPHLVGGKIGKGAFGKVKEGLCADSLQRIAIKILPKKRVKKMVDTVIREIKLLRRLKHKNIVTLVDVFAKVEDNEGKAGIFPWFLTIEEEPIVWIFEDGTEEEKDTVLNTCILKKSYVRKVNVDRDIKPGNLLITTDGVIKITDFGIAECYDFYDDKAMFSQTFAGTHQFVPPEVLKDESETGFDGTKAGVVLYNMVSGRLPFEFADEENVIDLHEKIIKGDYEMPKDIPLECQDLICKILQKDPDQRLAIEKIQVHPWTLSYVQQPLNSAESNIKIYQDTNNSVSTNTKDNDIPCDTTMVPFLLQLHQEELERDLEDTGIIPLWSSSEDDVRFVNKGVWQKEEKDD
ncbi:Serine/threonine-protein kinase stk11 [Terramyces sp. JEL0728]|nr:Serine/threonine-protein kinase stk11 [Terramyces sp. JEL0728]